MRNYGKTSVDYNNKESDIDEDSDDNEEDWKVEAEESDSDIDVGEMSDDDGECRIRSKRIIYLLSKSIQISFILICY